MLTNNITANIPQFTFDE